MIKVNLLPKKAGVGIPAIAGANLSNLNLKAVLIFGAINLFVPGIFQNIYEEKLAEISAESKSLNDKIRKLNRELSGKKKLEKAIDQLITQEKNLKRRLGVVKKIIKIKNNPSKILHYLAKNTPKDLWLVSLKVYVENESNMISIKGESVSYKSIGIFIESLKNSVFFQRGVRLVNSQTKSDSKTGMRTEEFELVGKITRFN